ncbi:MAG: hypothetical protein NZT61_05410 [Deltaproteobacteria bacterium]|nr:hypothetical protein [Deltaproteobacteria bacterium]MCX7952987.1 hypothetical protein [Deltaproteobacteria bacterium]
MKYFADLTICGPQDDQEIIERLCANLSLNVCLIKDVDDSEKCSLVEKKHGGSVILTVSGGREPVLSIIRAVKSGATINCSYFLKSYEENFIKQIIALHNFCVFDSEFLEVLGVTRLLYDLRWIEGAHFRELVLASVPKSNHFKDIEITCDFQKSSSRLNVAWFVSEFLGTVSIEAVSSSSVNLSSAFGAVRISNSQILSVQFRIGSRNIAISYDGYVLKSNVAGSYSVIQQSVWDLMLASLVNPTVFVNYRTVKNIEESIFGETVYGIFQA